MIVVLRLTALAVMLCSIFTSAAHAMTGEEIEARFRQLEQENTALKEKLEQVESILKQQGVDPANPLTEQTVSASANAETPKPVPPQRFQQRSVEGIDRVKVDGFLSAGFSTNGETGGLQQIPYGFKEGADFESDAVLGVQVNFRIDERTKVVTQVVANGYDSWNADIGWAYLAYEINDKLEIRAGRMRLPLYHYSESLDVGYSYPWVRPPIVLYSPEISNYDGFDATYSMRWGDSLNRLSAYYGSYGFEENAVDRDVDVNGQDVMGFNWTTYLNDWTFRAGYSQLRNKASFDFARRVVGQTINPGTGAFDPNGGVVVGQVEIDSATFAETINFYSYSTAYDDGNWLAILETAVTDASEEVLAGDAVQGVFTLGYRFGQWLPYLGYGREYYKDELVSPIAGGNLARSNNRDYKLNFAGLRYDVSPGVAAKLEWNQFYDLKGSSGPFPDAPTFVDGDSFDSIDTFTFLIDAVF